MVSKAIQAPPTLRRLLLPGVLSLCAVGAGAWACALTDVPASVWGRNLAAWVAGGLAASLLQRSGARVLGPVLPLAAVLLGATFLFPGQSGVHRWLSLGPLSINAAMLVLPAAVVSLAMSGGTSRWRWLAALACMALLAAQPDRSQASAWGLAILWIAIRRRPDRTMQLAVVAALAGLLAAAWVRSDPLKPVPEVEGIFQLALAVSPGLAGAALASLLAFSLTPIWMSRGLSSPNRAPGEALALYLFVSAAMPFLGAYPVPLVGMGVSPVLGAWLAIGSLSAARSMAD